MKECTGSTGGWCFLLRILSAFEFGRGGGAADRPLSGPVVRVSGCHAHGAPPCCEYRELRATICRVGGSLEAALFARFDADGAGAGGACCNTVIVVGLYIAKTTEACAREQHQEDTL